MGKTTVARSEQDGLAAVAAARMSDDDKAVLRRRFLAGEPEARFAVAAMVRKATAPRVPVAKGGA